VDSKLFDSDSLTLVVGDVHISAGQNMHRAKILGRMIEDVKPNTVVFIGDLLTFDSLSAWDRDKRLKMEGRRYVKDIDAGKKFLDIVDSNINTASPDYVLTEGNHETRLWRYLEYNPVLKGQIDYVKDLDIAHWTVVDYGKYWRHKGVSFTHVPINESGRPVSGDAACKRSLSICNDNVLFGHTHKLASCSIHRHNGAHLTQAVNVGCFFEHIDDYALGSVTSYWRGLVLVDHYKHGSFNWNPIRLGKLRKVYGD